MSRPVEEPSRPVEEPRQSIAIAHITIAACFVETNGDDSEWERILPGWRKAIHEVHDLIQQLCTLRSNGRFDLPEPVIIPATCAYCYQEYGVERARNFLQAWKDQGVHVLDESFQTLSSENLQDIIDSNLPGGDILQLEADYVSQAGIPLLEPIPKRYDRCKAKVDFEIWGPQELRACLDEVNNQIPGTHLKFPIPSGQGTSNLLIEGKDRFFQDKASTTTTLNLVNTTALGNFTTSPWAILVNALIILVWVWSRHIKAEQGERVGSTPNDALASSTTPPSSGGSSPPLYSLSDKPGSGAIQAQRSRNSFPLPGSGVINNSYSRLSSSIPSPSTSTSNHTHQNSVSSILEFTENSGISSINAANKSSYDLNALQFSEQEVPLTELPSINQWSTSSKFQQKIDEKDNQSSQHLRVLDIQTSSVDNYFLDRGEFFPQISPNSDSIDTDQARSSNGFEPSFSSENEEPPLDSLSDISGSVGSIPENHSSSSNTSNSGLSEEHNSISSNLESSDPLPDPQSTDGLGGRQTFIMQPMNGLMVIDNFRGVGRGSYPSQEIIDDIDILHFQGIGLIAVNMLLTQESDDLVITFEGTSLAKVVLTNFALENLDNLSQETPLSTTLGNILFDGDDKIKDSFDIFNSDWTLNQVLRRNTVTFLNDLDNYVMGFDNSDDVINGQGGNDIIITFSGNDVIRGGAGNDILDGGSGTNTLWGNVGSDTFVLSPSGTQYVKDFALGQDYIGLPDGLSIAQLKIEQGMEINGSSTWIKRASDDALLMVLDGVQASMLSTDLFLPVTSIYSAL